MNLSSSDAFLIVLLGFSLSFLVAFIVSQRSKRELLRDNADLGAQLAASTSANALIQANKEELVSNLKESYEAQLAEKSADLTQADLKLAECENQRASLLAELESQKSQRQMLEQRYLQEREQLDQQKKMLTQEFEQIASKIFERQGSSISEINQKSIETLLQPFKERIDGFQKRVNDVHAESIKGNVSLEAELKKVLDVGLKMSSEANNLTQALKGDSQKRGAWGEAQLERTLEMSGLVEDVHYSKQESFKDVEGKTKQVDYLISLPDSKQIVIDSKVSLVAYDKALSADSIELQNLAFEEHAQSVKKHIDDLASKDYSNLVGLQSPNFVLLFMPIEPAYIEALKNRKVDLFGYGYSKSVILVSHTTLIPILRTVANLWMMEHSNAEAKEISEKAGEIYNQVCLMAERLYKLGGSLNAASNHYNTTVRSLVGQQGLHAKVERFGQISSNATREMPNIETIYPDLETNRLETVLAEEKDKTGSVELE